MYLSQQKEQFSLAYIHAVATVAGFALADVRVDDDSVDLLICSRSRSGKIHSPRMEVQAKCTATHLPNDTHITFPLAMKNYDDLRDPQLHIPRILIVMTVPETVADWLDHSEAHLRLKRCAYWLSLFGQPDVSSTAADARVTVHLLRSQPFNVEQLQTMMSRIAAGNRP